MLSFQPGGCYFTQRALNGLTTLSANLIQYTTNRAVSVATTLFWADQKQRMHLGAVVELKCR